jgi:hypothetical protein
MNNYLADFVLQWLRIAVMALVPVVLTAFVSIPMNLGGHPGETVARTVVPSTHMT